MRVRSVTQNAVLALAGDVSAKAGMLAVMMVAARGLSTSQFALLASSLAVATILTAGLDLGSQTLLTREGVAGATQRGGLLVALALARLPLLAVALAVAVVLGVLAGRPLEAVATVLIGAAGAIQLSLTGALRSAQDLRPEAIAKLAAGALALVGAGACVLLAPRASVMLLALAAGMLLALIPVVRAGRHAIRRGQPPPAWRALVRAAPLGAMTLATLAYYRSGTISLSLLSTSRQTARFAAASTLAWGLLCVANAVTTGLLPRLAGAGSARERAALTRTWLWRTTVLCGVLAAIAVALAGPLLALVYGSRYGAAAAPFAILAGATVLIAPAGVLGTALVAAGRLRPLCVQVGASLAINLVALGVLVPRAGAMGAAGATVACELAALVLLGAAARSALPELNLTLSLPHVVAARAGR